MIVSFALDNIQVKKEHSPKGDLEARNNVKITNLKEQTLTGLTKSQVALGISFSFSVSYEPKVASIQLEGKVIYVTDAKTRDEMMASWNKDKSVDPKLSQPILNNILQKCNIKALSLATDVNLPPHIPFPRLALKSQLEGNQEKKAA